MSLVCVSPGVEFWVNGESALSIKIGLLQEHIIPDAPQQRVTALKRHSLANTWCLSEGFIAVKAA